MTLTAKPDAFFEPPRDVASTRMILDPDAPALHTVTVSTGMTNAQVDKVNQRCRELSVQPLIQGWESLRDVHADQPSPKPRGATAATLGYVAMIIASIRFLR